MRRFVTIWIGCLAAATAGRADIKTDHGAGTHLYQDIIRQNPFRLEPIPLLEAAPKPVASNSFVDLKLTGISASAGHKSAYLLCEERGRPPHYFSLAEGQKEGAWEVVAIDAVNETVRLRCQGIERVFSLKTNGVKSGVQVALENRRFVDEHTRAHERHQQRERERVDRERALADLELKTREQARRATMETLTASPLEKSGFPDEIRGPADEPVPSLPYETQPQNETPR
ncbi:MAG TPA: hypothetical protein VJW76_04150 [Verrucomicrobiae bacterium]|nr:hypothetical protein [Verrucomicrobiae bacterium]